MNRVNFIESVTGILYPEMIVTFFDHFIALKRLVEDSGSLVEDSGSIQVLESSNNSITFSITFKDVHMKMSASNVIQSCGNMIVVYGRHITIQIEELSDNSIKINLI
jgi:hypothetical protein